MKASAVTPDRAQKSPSRGGAGGRMTNSAGKTNFGDSVRLLISPMEAVTVKEAVRRLKESIPKGYIITSIAGNVFFAAGDVYVRGDSIRVTFELSV